MYSKSYYNGRRNFMIVSLLLLIFIGVYLLYLHSNISLTGKLRPCAFNGLAHIYCPGCGGTRAVEYFLHGNFLASLMCHPIVIYSAGVFLLYYIQAFYTFIIKRNGIKYYRFYYAPLYAFPIIIVVFFIIRNLLLIIFKYDYIGDCISYWI